MTRQTSPSTAAGTDAAIEREVRIEAPPEIVFAFWTDPDRLVRWMGRTATIDARAGGAVRIDYNGTDVARGEIVEIDPPRRLVLTWGWEAPGDPTPPGASRVEVTFEPDGGATRLRLRHTGLAPEAVTGHAEGWDFFLPALSTAATARGGSAAG